MRKHTLLLKCIITFLRYMMIVRRAPDSIYKHLMVHMVSFLPKITVKLCAKYQLFDTLSARDIGQCAVRKDTHCCLSVLYPSLDV